MVAKVTQSWASLSSEFETPPGGTCNRTSTRKYSIRNAFTRVEAETAMLSVPAVDGTMVRRSIAVTELRYGFWRATVQYSTVPPKGIGDIDFRGSTSGGTAHITHSLATVRSVGINGHTPTDHQGAIGVVSGETRTIEGVDIKVPELNFSVTKRFAAGHISLANIAVWYGMSKTTNNAPWGPAGSEFTFAKHELLFEGVDFDVGSQDCDTVTFMFSGSPNRDVPIGSTGESIQKDGFEYLWIDSRPVEDENAKAIAERPVAANVEQVYYESNFASLGI